MSGPHEGWEPAEDEGTDPTPPPSAPPSFGKADPVTGDGPEGGGGEPAAAPSDAEIRLPIGLQRPWWASADETAPEAETAEPEPEQEPEAEPEQEPLAEADEPDEAEEDDGTVVFEPPEPTTGPDQDTDQPLPGTPPGTLVAGHGIPKIDTRGAVPAEPIVAPSGPRYPDTDPDGIPVIQPEEAKAAAPETEEPEPPQEGTTGGIPVTVATPEAFRPRDEPPPPSPPPTPLAAPVPVAMAPEPQSQAPEPPPEQQTFGIASFSAGTATAATAAPGGSGGGRRKPLLIGGGVLAMILVAVAGFAVAGSGNDSEGRRAKAVETPGGKTDPLLSRAPAASPAPGAGQPPPPAAPVPIDSVRTDPKPLALTEAFPAARVDMGGRTYSRDRASVNHQCALAARGAMARALTRERCDSIIRVTFLDKQRALALTTGIAVLPAKPAALKVNGAGDPGRYEWFRAMPGTRTPGIDRAGGYAASTVRGRYIAYAYATFANGQPPKSGDQTLKSVAEQFVGYALRPIDARARR
ncbi:hypothetical protein GCM10010191_80160 [Actinomadura vinacea]|uniref:Uncharacterized protein n=1 Tax=Actinomadura vinacea TaxID=115336 RepID=A0ABP5XE12_9ACTN